MTTGQKTLLWIVGGLSVVGVGVGLYIWLSKSGKAKESEADKAKRLAGEAAEANQQKQIASQTGNANAKLPSGFPIKKGDSGDAVKRAQIALINLGYGSDIGGTATGYYGEKTAAIAQKLLGRQSPIYESTVVSWENTYKKYKDQQAQSSQPRKWKVGDMVTVKSTVSGHYVDPNANWDVRNESGSFNNGDSLKVVALLPNNNTVVSKSSTFSDDVYMIVNDNNLIRP